jgi:hypothetical protein
MKILFLHGWQSAPGGVKPTFLAQHGHEIINPKSPDEDFTLAIKIAREEFDKHKPDVMVGSSRGGAVALFSSEFRLRIRLKKSAARTAEGANSRDPQARTSPSSSTSTWTTFGQQHTGQSTTTAEPRVKASGGYFEQAPANPGEGSGMSVAHISFSMSEDTYSFRSLTAAINAEPSPVIAPMIPPAPQPTDMKADRRPERGGVPCPSFILSIRTPRAKPINNPKKLNTKASPKIFHRFLSFSSIESLIAIASKVAWTYDVPATTPAVVS